MSLRLLIAISVYLACNSAQPAEPTPSHDDDFVAGFIEGEYVVIGKKPDSEETYTGRMIFKKHGADLEFSRQVAGQTSDGPVTFDKTASENGKPVLRVHFSLDGQPYEATYLWSSDLNNYARLTGYVYSPMKGKTKFPGLEALFPLADYNRIVD